MTEEFVEIIADMMEKDPATRIQTAAEVAARLEPWADEASPLPSQQLSKSRWMAPPILVDSPEEAPAGEIAEVQVSDGADLDSRGLESQQSHFSQGTEAVGSARYDTKGSRARRRSRLAPPLTLSDSSEEVEAWPVGLAVAVALAIAVPVSMLFGAALTFLLLRLRG